LSIPLWLSLTAAALEARIGAALTAAVSAGLTEVTLTVVASAVSTAVALVAGFRVSAGRLRDSIQAGLAEAETPTADVTIGTVVTATTEDATIEAAMIAAGVMIADVPTETDLRATIRADAEAQTQSPGGRRRSESA